MKACLLVLLLFVCTVFESLGCSKPNEEVGQCTHTCKQDGSCTLKAEWELENGKLKTEFPSCDSKANGGKCEQRGWHPCDDCIKKCGGGSKRPVTITVKKPICMIPQVYVFI